MREVGGVIGQVDTCSERAWESDRTVDTCSEIGWGSDRIGKYL